METCDLPSYPSTVSLTVPFTAYVQESDNTFGSYIPTESNELYGDLTKTFVNVLSLTAVAQNTVPVHAQAIAEDAALFGDDEDFASTPTPQQGEPQVVVMCFRTEKYHGYTIFAYGFNPLQLNSVAKGLEPKNPTMTGHYAANLHNENENQKRIPSDTTYKNTTFVDGYGSTPYPVYDTKLLEFKCYKVPLECLHPECFMELPFPWSVNSNFYETHATEFLIKYGRSMGLALDEVNFGNSLPCTIRAKLNPRKLPEPDYNDKKNDYGKRPRMDSKPDEKKKKRKTLFEKKKGIFPFERTVNSETQLWRDHVYFMNAINTDYASVEPGNERTPQQLDQFADSLWNDFWTSKKAEVDMSEPVKALKEWRTITTNNTTSHEPVIANSKFSPLGNGIADYLMFVQHCQRAENPLHMMTIRLSSLELYSGEPMHNHIIFYGPPGTGKSEQFKMLARTMIKGTSEEPSTTASSKSNYTENPKSYILLIYGETPGHFHMLPKPGDEAFEQLKEFMTSSKVEYTFFCSVSTEKGKEAGSNGIADRKQLTVTSWIHKAIIGAQNVSTRKAATSIQSRIFSISVYSDPKMGGPRYKMFTGAVSDASADRKNVYDIFVRNSQQIQYIAALFQFYMKSGASRAGINKVPFALIMTFILNKLKEKGVQTDEARDYKRAENAARTFMVLRIVYELFYTKNAMFKDRDLAKDDIDSLVLREMEKRAVIGVEETLMAATLFSPQWAEPHVSDVRQAMRKQLFKFDLGEEESMLNEELLLKYHKVTIKDSTINTSPDHSIAACMYTPHHDAVQSSVARKGRPTHGENGGEKYYSGKSTNIVDLNYVVFEAKTMDIVIKKLIMAFEYKPTQEAIKTTIDKLKSTYVHPEKYFKQVSEDVYTNAIEITGNDRTFFGQTMIEGQHLTNPPAEGIPVIQDVGTDVYPSRQCRFAVALHFLMDVNNSGTIEDIIKKEFPHTGMKERTVCLFNHSSQGVIPVHLVEPKTHKPFSIANPSPQNNATTQWFSNFKTAEEQTESDDILHKWAKAENIETTTDIDVLAQKLHWDALGLPEEERVKVEQYAEMIQESQ